MIDITAFERCTVDNQQLIAVKHEHLTSLYQLQFTSMENEKPILRFGGTKRRVETNKPDMLMAVDVKLTDKFFTTDGLSVNSINTCSN